MANPPEAEDTKRSKWYNKLDKDMTSHMRETLLIVAALIAAVTFQAGVNPPGGVWQETKDNHKAGCAVYASRKEPFYTFLTFNTLALSTSILLLLSLTFRFHYRLEVLVATLSMFATYASAIFAIAPPESVNYRYLLITAAAPFLTRALVELFKIFRKKCAKAVP